jgi:NAD-dependent SIR2 family protein deacetylase
MKTDEVMIKAAIKVIEAADAVLITAGAGMGVDSGLPDYRGDEGLWKQYPKFKNLGVSFSAIINPQLFEINPYLAWGFYGHRLNLYRETQPHEGFELLRKYCLNKKGGFFVVTSNVDGQFQKAGFDATKIFEIHGSIHYTQCLNRCSSEVFDNEMYDFNIDLETLNIDKLPTCPYCESLLRPNILMFSDGSLRLERLQIQNDRFERWLDSTRPYKLVIIEIGAGPDIPAIREYGEKINEERNNATLIRINPDNKGNTDITLESKGLETLKLLFGQ